MSRVTPTEDLMTDPPVYDSQACQYLLDGGREGGTMLGVDIS